MCIIENSTKSQDINKLLEMYINEYDIMYSQYHLMGMLLNDKQVQRRVKELGLKDCYVYGGGFLGIQCYQAIKNHVNIKAIVDKNRRLKFELEDVKVIDIPTLIEKYCSEKIIITPVQYSANIYKELKKLIPTENILFLGEFVQGDI